MDIRNRPKFEVREETIDERITAMLSWTSSHVASVYDDGRAN